MIMKKLIQLINAIVMELSQNRPGMDRIVKVLTEYMIIELIRFILGNSLFVEKTHHKFNIFQRSSTH